MGKRGHVVIIFVLLIFCLNILSAQCLDRYEPSNFKNRLRRILLSIVLGITTGLICALLFALLVRHFVRYINKAPVIKGPVVFSPKISSRTLKSALSNEPHLLRSSPSGKYYRVVLDNGLNIAVKRIEPVYPGTPQEKGVKKKINQEFESLAKLRHRNLMSLRGYVCESDGGYTLVYDYVPTGSLEDVMKRVRDNDLVLKWEFRLRIAVGIIKGLYYLHFTCDPRRLHYNLKPSNVMLDGEYEPRLGDCGLAAILPNFYRASDSGYTAPECSQNCRYSEKSDIFSFGMILGILLTGRDPLDPFFSEPTRGGSLGQWLRHLQQGGEAREALDKSILGEEMEEEEMLMAVRIAAVCLSELPSDRPSSDELVSMLTQLNSF